MAHGPIDLMPSERIQRQIDRLLDEADAAISRADWETAHSRASAALAFDPENADALAYLQAAERAGAVPAPDDGVSAAATGSAPATPAPTAALPEEFAGGRYRVKRFLGEGGRKRVYLAHDERLDRDVAVALIKTEGLDSAGMERVRREARAMARLGGHPHIVTVFDVTGEHEQPLLVSQFMAGGSVEDLMATADERRLPTARVLQIAEQVCQALDFAHRQGVIHRDLKPGNVWLADDGTAKLGDFGLAVALDRSRVTMAGMMVGTVAYMPPEQALGAESSPKADLYSLGCMLYEMVTGRPPFLGDEATAVISQHINVPPVAPSWLTDHCPPELEEIILRLLAKVPEDRPASAADVREALLKVDSEKKSQSHSDSSENPLDRLARGVFVGRQPELDRLRKAFDEAFAGRGGLVMLVGEPGIGKTRTTQELETYARMRGAQVLWGRTHESGGAPAYWPWYQAGNQFAAANDIATVVAPQLPPGAGAELSRIFTWLRQQPNFVEPEPISDPESARFRLFDAYAAFVRAMASQTPLVIALDDLHWADKPSLLLLQHLARELSRLRILIVGNYRDTDITRQSALSETLAVLNRESGFERIVLRGLTRDETASYIRATANIEPRREVLDRIYEETEGNAFFLAEVVNLMAQEGTLSRESVSDIRIPDGVREALGRRLNRLSEETNELLQVAAIVGREFTYDMLTLLGDSDDDSLLKLIEEALEARVIEELPQPGRYRFTHAQMQETLLNELSTTRRVRLHGQVGEALEKRWGDDLARQRAPRLAHHFVEAAMVSTRHAQQGVLYSKLAAAESEERLAWDEAARHYENCLSLVTASDLTFGEDEAHLLTALGRCQVHEGSHRAAWRSLMRATMLYRQRGDWAGSALATVQALAVPAPPARFLEIITAALDAPGERDPHLEATLLTARAGIARDQEDFDRAAALSEEHDLADIRAWLTANAARRAPDPQEALRLFRLASEQFQAAGERAGPSLLSARRLGGVLVSVAVIVYYSGRLDEAEAAWENVLKYGRSMHFSYYTENPPGYLGLIALLRCDLAGARARLGEIGAGTYMREVLAASLAEFGGNLDAASETLPAPDVIGGVPLFAVQVHGTRARILFERGDLDASRQELEAWAQAVPSLLVQAVSIGPGDVASIGPALARIGDDEMVGRMLEFTAAAPDLHFGFFGSLDHFRGTLALRLDKIDEAEAWFRTGLEVCQRERCPVEAGRNLVGRAEVAVRRGQTRDALEDLDRAIGLFQQHGAKLYLDQALGMKVRLQGIGSSVSSIDAVADSVQSEHPDLASVAAPDGSITVLVSDIEDSTALNERVGDAAWIEALRHHNAMMRAHIAAHRGHEVKTFGDAFMVVFADPVEALQCAVDIQRDFARWNNEPQIRVRVGLHTGQAVRDEGDFFGTNVTFAFRVAALGKAAQILVSSALKELAAASGEFAFDDGFEVELKGLSGTQRVYEVAWS
jgi:eukaryotic-like serine/threonine-protein kinase